MYTCDVQHAQNCTALIVFNLHKNIYLQKYVWIKAAMRRWNPFSMSEKRSTARTRSISWRFCCQRNSALVLYSVNTCKGRDRVDRMSRREGLREDEPPWRRRAYERHRSRVSNFPEYYNYYFRVILIVNTERRIFNNSKRSIIQVYIRHIKAKIVILDYRD